MNIGNVKGNGGNHGPERTVLLQPHRTPVRSDGRDEAAISAGGQRAAEALEDLTARARAEQPERAAKVAAAKARLEGGVLDGDRALRGTAEAILDSDFTAG